jgi:signal transduction histidine kinase
MVLNIDLLFVGIVIAGMGVLGFSIFFNNKESITNFSLFLFSIITIIWSVVNYFAYNTNNPYISFWLFRLVIALATWHAFMFFQTFLVFPNEKITFPKLYKYLLLPLVILISLLNLTPFVFSSIGKISPSGEILKINNGPGIAFFGVLILFLVIGGLFMLILKTIKAKPEDRRKFFIVLLGVFITFFLLILFNFIFPAFLNNPNFIPYGGLFIVPFILFTSYAIIRHKLFNIRVAGTALLVFGLSIVSFLEITQADNWLMILYRSSVLFFILIFGILLIRGVLKEVKLREDIAQMAEDVRKAYVIEKRAKEELAQLDKIKDQFLMQTQHDLRTPLTSIMGYTDLLLAGTFGKLTKKSLEVLQKLQGITKSMIKKTNNFLDLAQFQLGKSVLAITPGVEVFPILQEIKDELDFKADSKNIKLTLEESKEKVTIPADREKLKAALFNIVDNSVKYTQEGGVTITLTTKDNKAVISVKDTGIGIPKDKVATIFDSMFSRTEQAQKTATGAGVGLYLSTKIIRDHKGKVWAESEGIAGKGSQFHVELPLN